MRVAIEVRVEILHVDLAADALAEERDVRADAGPRSTSTLTGLEQTTDRNFCKVVLRTTGVSATAAVLDASKLIVDRGHRG